MAGALGGQPRIPRFESGHIQARLEIGPEPAPVNDDAKLPLLP